MTNSNGSTPSGTTLRLIYEAVVAGYIRDISDRSAGSPRDREDIEPAREELLPQAA